MPTKMKDHTCCSDKNTPSTTTQPSQEKTATRVTTVKPGYESRYDDQAWEVNVKLPGVSREDIRVEIEDEILVIQAQRSTTLGEDWKPLGQYPSNREYRLHLDVGPEVNPAGIQARFENGLLTLRLPLKEEIKPRKIEVL